MPYKIDYLDDAVLRWTLTDDGAVCSRDQDYTPSIYVAAPTHRALETISDHIGLFTEVERTAFESWRVGWRHPPEPVLRVDIDHIDHVTTVAADIRDWGDPGEYQPYTVDFSREFRYCLETNANPTPTRRPTRLQLRVPQPEFGRDDGIRLIEIDGDRFDGDPASVATETAARINATDPDVLVVNRAALIPKLFAAAPDADYQLGRRPGYQELAGRSTYESYGRIGHSPARYNVPGRAIIDESNTFLYHTAGFPGVIDMVERSWKPLQESAWASIGNVLTAIQIREAHARGVLTPWNSWRHEFFKTARQLHDADRGGFIFAPEAGFHENVHELDFSALYPNIMVTRNISPETVCCDCHADRADVPGLGYSICDDRGYLPDVLEPLVTDRDAIKAALPETDDEDRRRRLRGKADALKWILVSCFGYQGFSNAKFGRIECHEAINAFAREILLVAKDMLEAGGWQIVHGIVDSIWVKPIPGATPESLVALAAAITERVGIRLEYEGAFEWVAFVPLRHEESGALTKYFGARANPSEEDEPYKFRGIEIRQRSTPSFIAAAQMELIETLDRTRDPESVCEVLQRQLATLRAGTVDPGELVIDNRVSKRRPAYTQYTRNVAALERAADVGLTKYPGENVSYVVVDDEKRSRDRVALGFEELDRYDEEFYAELLIRAAESVVSPLGWREDDIKAYLADGVDARLTAF